MESKPETSNSREEFDENIRAIVQIMATLPSQPQKRHKRKAKGLREDLNDAADDV